MGGYVVRQLSGHRLRQVDVHQRRADDGDGTQRGGNELFQESKRRGHALSVVGIPKTVDNDVAFVASTFGYFTAVEEAVKVLDCAHIEARSVHNGLSLVKLLGRDAGFIAAGAAVANQDVNFTLIPEVPFNLDEKVAMDRDASGNIKLKDIGLLLRERVESYFKGANISVVVRYFDPNYLIRSSPANAADAILCDLLRAQRHARCNGWQNRLSHRISARCIYSYPY